MATLDLMFAHSNQRQIDMICVEAFLESVIEWNGIHSDNELNMLQYIIGNQQQTLI